jgi:RND family efflux transporter MFP subunit
MLRVVCSIFILITLSAESTAAELVTVKSLGDVAIQLERQAAARVESLNEAVLSAELAARVVEIPVRAGQLVARGDLLLRLDPASYEIQLKAAQARLQMAEAGFELARLRAERARRLAPDRFVSEDQLLEAETRFAQARAERSAVEQDVASARLQLDRTRVTSPFDAVISARLIGVGALAAPGTPLVEVVARDQLEIVAGIAPEQAEGLSRAHNPVFESQGQNWSLELLRLSPLISPSTRSREARFAFVGEAPPVGSEGRVRWQDPRLALPPDYLVQRNGRLGVLVLEDDQTAGFIELPQADAGRPVVVDLAPDLILIDEGRRRLQPGDPVRF